MNAVTRAPSAAVKIVASGAGVVDEVRMLICPTSRGTGTRILRIGAT